MKDIDFDELDRAVSSVLSKAAPAGAPVQVSREEAPSQVSASTQSVTPEPPHTAQSQPVAAIANTSESRTEVTTPTPDVTSASTSPITLRPRGKFMDVMHPSADMNPGASSGSRPAFTPPRTLAPLTARNMDQPEPTATVDESSALIGAEPAPVTDTPSEVATSPEAPEETLLLPAETDEETGDDSNVTAPIETASYVDPLDVATPPTGAAASEEAPRPDTTPQTTPFLSDTKVDKRPLGAFGDADEQDSDASKNSPDDTQTAPVVPLPRELQPDVVQVESVQEPDQTGAPDKPFASSVSVAADADDGRVEGHPLFDTSTYHEPIAAVHAKKTAPWIFWVVGLGICLVIGAGVGYFLFTAGF